MNKKKMCSFFVSEYHLLTMLLPYINEEIAKNKNLIIFTEEDLNDSLKKYLKRNNKYSSSKIMKLGWNKTKENKIEKVEEIAIVIGNKKYIDEINIKLDNIDKLKEVVNCYNVERISDLNQIVLEHDSILKTVGEIKVSKSSHNEQKRKTIQTQI